MCAEDTEETQPGLMLLFIDQVMKHVNSETVDDLKIKVRCGPCPKPRAAICNCKGLVLKQFADARFTGLQWSCIRWLTSWEKTLMIQKTTYLALWAAHDCWKFFPTPPSSPLLQSWDLLQVSSSSAFFFFHSDIFPGCCRLMLLWRHQLLFYLIAQSASRCLWMGVSAQKIKVDWLIENEGAAEKASRGLSLQSQERIQYLDCTSAICEIIMGWFPELHIQTQMI